MKWKWVAWGAAALVLVVLLATHHGDSDHHDVDARHSDPISQRDPARYAASVRTYARAAGVDPRLVMAILYNESYKPHDPDTERAWQRVKPDAAFGVANMHHATFDETKRGRDFADRRWRELPDDPKLAIEAEAWYLHDLAAELPAGRAGGYSTTELLALGYNTGGGNMLAFSQGASADDDARAYLHRLHGNWKRASAAVAGS
ncbi:MAG TPA: transglycosylase SLT domain-containing protein [Stackebrandtia sp.]|uniref:transglycosylase SLT domain-containing protein n=1 Tax=Stackebrandtia sp. TaxID=2023065 RepID=UPI002D6CC501|nr:transglycosylase SLT domain-containing protein [Stackebrandtia sp.]HZE41015.1 transglycosylase SLT domain-containing protein [Stackebrandtia sp.]